MIECAKRGEISCIVVKDLLSLWKRLFLRLAITWSISSLFLGIRFKSINDHYDSERMKARLSGWMLPSKT